MVATLRMRRRPHRRLPPHRPPPRPPAAAGKANRRALSRPFKMKTGRTVMTGRPVCRSAELLLTGVLGHGDEALAHVYLHFVGDLFGALGGHRVAGLHLHALSLIHI